MANQGQEFVQQQVQQDERRSAFSSPAPVALLADQHRHAMTWLCIVLVARPVHDPCNLCGHTAYSYSEGRFGPGWQKTGFVPVRHSHFLFSMAVALLSAIPFGQLFGRINDGITRSQLR